MLLLFLIITSIGYLVFAVVSVSREIRGTGMSKANRLHPAMKFVFGGGAPLVVAATMAYLFLIVGGATTAQFNAGSPSRMDAWSAWVELWPVFLFITATSSVGTLIWMIVCSINKSQRSSLLVSVVSFFFSILAFFTVVSYFPSA